MEFVRGPEIIKGECVVWDKGNSGGDPVYEYEWGANRVDRVVSNSDCV